MAAYKEGNSARIVLPVAVEPQNQVVIVAQGEFHACLHRPANTQIDWMANNHHAGGTGNGGGIIGRTVIDNQNICMGHRIAHFENDTPNAVLFVVCRDKDQDAFGPFQ